MTNHFFVALQIPDIVFESITDESVNWTKNQACFNELQLIKTAFTNADEWAIESKFPIFDYFDLLAAKFSIKK